MLPLLINKREVNLPTAWEEITFRQYMAMQDESKSIPELRLLSALSGIDYGTLLNCDPSSFDQYIPLMDFTSAPLDLSKRERAKSLIIKGVECKVPDDPGTNSLGQSLMLRAALREAAEAERNPVYLMPFAIAVYLQPQLNKGKTDDAMVRKIAEELQDYPLLTVYPTGNFFLTSFISSYN